MTNNPYEILGLENDATPNEIKQAYRRLAMKYHPDRNPDNAEAEAAFKRIKTAYDQLTGKTPNLRAASKPRRDMFHIDRVDLTARDVEHLSAICRALEIEASYENIAKMTAVAMVVAEFWGLLPIMRIVPPKGAKEKARAFEIASLAQKMMHQSRTAGVLEVPLFSSTGSYSRVFGKLCLWGKVVIPTEMHLANGVSLAIEVLSFLFDEACKGNSLYNPFFTRLDLWEDLHSSFHPHANPWQKLPPGLRTLARHPLLWARYGRKG